MSKTITIVISPDGDTSVDLAGFHGQGCSQVMEDFTAPGDKVKRVVTKREFHQAATQKQEQKA